MVRARFARLVILDPIILLKRHREQLGTCAHEVREYSATSAEDGLRTLEQDMEAHPAPMCWTQLAQRDWDEEELNRRLEGADAAITCWTGFSDDVLRSNRQLRYIGLWTNLARHRMDIGLAQGLGIHVTYVPDYGTDSVAELTIAGMLALSRRLLESARDTARGKWPYELLKGGVHVPSVDEIRQRMLRGRMLGIVGFGRIGQRVAELALAFGMKVQYYSRHRQHEFEARGVSFSTLANLFSSSDIVSVHLAPYAPDKTVNGALLRQLRDGAIFVNTSAGRLVDQDALFAEIESGRISAFLDVYEGLPPRRQLKDLSHLNNLFTYRSGWFTREAITYKGDMLVRNVEDHLCGRPGLVPSDEDDAVDPTEAPCGGARRHEGPTERAGI